MIIYSKLAFFFVSLMEDYNNSNINNLIFDIFLFFLFLTILDFFHVSIKVELIPRSILESIPGFISGPILGYILGLFP